MTSESRHTFSTPYLNTRREKGSLDSPRVYRPGGVNPRSPGTRSWLTQQESSSHCRWHYVSSTCFICPYLCSHALQPPTKSNLCVLTNFTCVSHERFNIIGTYYYNTNQHPTHEPDVSLHPSNSRYINAAPTRGTTESQYVPVTGSRSHHINQRVTKRR